jgi:hypothetical protein
MRPHGPFLAILAATILCGECFEVTHPLTNSVVLAEGEENAVEIQYRFHFDLADILAEKVTMKVDVFGYADPDGWQSHELGPHMVQSGGWINGSLRIFDLEPGAVRIRLRAMRAEDSDVVSEVSLDYFLKTDKITSGEALAQDWLKQSVLHEDSQGGVLYPRGPSTLLHADHA